MCVSHVVLLRMWSWSGKTSRISALLFDIQQHCKLFHYLSLTLHCSLSTENVTEIKTNIFVTSFGPVSDTEMVSWTIANSIDRQALRIFRWFRLYLHFTASAVSLKAMSRFEDGFSFDREWQKNKCVRLNFFPMCCDLPIPTSLQMIRHFINALIMRVVPPG